MEQLSKEELLKKVSFFTDCCNFILRAILEDSNGFKISKYRKTIQEEDSFALTLSKYFPDKDVVYRFEVWDILRDCLHNISLRTDCIYLDKQIFVHKYSKTGSLNEQLEIYFHTSYWNLPSSEGRTPKMQLRLPPSELEVKFDTRDDARNISRFFSYKDENILTHVDVIKFLDTIDEVRKESKIIPMGKWKEFYD